MAKKDNIHDVVTDFGAPPLKCLDTLPADLSAAGSLLVFGELALGESTSGERAPGEPVQAR